MKVVLFLVLLATGCSGAVQTAELVSHDGRVREQAKARLATATESQKAALLAPLLDSMTSDDAPTVQRAADALTLIGPQAVPTLVQALDEKDPFVRLSAAGALGRIPGLDEPALAALERAAADAHSLVREVAVMALGSQGPSAERSVPHLVSRLRDPADDVRFAAQDALRKIGSPGAQAALAAAARTSTTPQKAK